MNLHRQPTDSNALSTWQKFAIRSMAASQLYTRFWFDCFTVNFTEANDELLKVHIHWHVLVQTFKQAANFRNDQVYAIYFLFADKNSFIDRPEIGIGISGQNYFQ